MKNTICAVIVTYKYPPDRLHALMVDIGKQVDGVCIVDNNSSSGNNAFRFSRRSFSGKYRFLFNDINAGLAKALNQGIVHAIQNGFNQVLLLDQDSRPSPDMVDRLLNAKQRCGQYAAAVGAVGPSVVDGESGGVFPFLKCDASRTKRIFPDVEATRPIPVGYLITSGTLIDVTVFEKTGLMDETLFIDGIDIEWGFRAKSMGYTLYGVPDAFLFHSLGDSCFKIPFLKERVFLHKRERQYFISRNRVILYKRNYIPAHWKRFDMVRLLARVVFFSLIISPRMQNSLMLFGGIVDGLRKSCKFAPRL